VPHSVAAHAGALPPVSSLFAAVLGVNPIQHLLAAAGVLATLPADGPAGPHRPRVLPQLYLQPFHNGLTVVFAVAAALAALAAVASLLRGVAATSIPNSSPAAPAPGTAVPAGPAATRPDHQWHCQHHQPHHQPHHRRGAR